ncbi:hypothetical protein Gogos_022157 [Gossypium gossypioides]|uniref:DUF4283 domain-containing protein n=1 Tax=Gossypium gossypioides TaxID=34282 RepID=A0A7J9D3W8_GOSGO|nr:hypothetical protein [Gossypium gossypioides]
MVGADLANLNIIDEEEDPLVVVRDVMSADPEYGLCLVGRVLTDSIVNFPSLKNKLANLWHSLRGVSIMEIEDKHILFRFYSKIDLKRVMDSMPWFFNRHLIVFHRLIRGEDPSIDSLWTTSFCPVQLTLRDQQVDFGWDLSLRATPRREGQLMSKWLREESENERKPMDLRIEDNMGQFEGRGDEAELENMLVKFVDRKKRKRFNLEVGGSDKRRGLLEGGLENTISATATEQVDRAQ